MRALPGSDDETRALRLRYNAALAAHVDAARALTEAFIRGDAPTADLIESEPQAKHVLESARRTLHKATSRDSRRRRTIHVGIVEDRAVQQTVAGGFFAFPNYFPVRDPIHVRCPPCEAG